jgi:hypothetical protein
MQASRMTIASARAIMAPNKQALPSESSGETRCQMFRASSSRVIKVTERANSSAGRVLYVSSATAAASGDPPSGVHTAKLIHDTEVIG